MTDLLLLSLVYQSWSALAQSLVCGILLALGVRLLLALISPTPSASTRYAVWFATLIAVAVMPAVFVARSVEAQRVATEVRRSVALPVEPARTEAPVAAVPATALPAELPPSVPFQRTGSDHPRWLVLPLDENVGASLTAIALIVTGLMLLRLLFSYARVWRLKRRVIEAPPEAVARFDVWRGQIPTHRSVRLLVSRKASSPMAVGFRHPAIIVPEALLLQLTREEFDHIGLHELAHIRRGDHWTNLAERVIQAMFWFSPAVHYICHRLELERELACDDAVLSIAGEPRRYARSLARVLELAPWRRGPVLASGAVFRKRQILSRIESLFDTARNSVPKASAITVVVIVMCLFGILGEFVRMPALIAFDRAFSGGHNRHRWNNNGRTIELETAGDVQFGTVEPTIESISSEGFVRVREGGGWPNREIVYTAAPSGPGLATRYLVDGREGPLDDKGRQWATTMLAWVIRESGINSEERVAAIFDKGGAQGVLDEVDRISSDHVRRKYLGALLDTAHRMPAEDVRRVFARVNRIGSDHDKAELLKQVSSHVKDPAVRGAYFDAVNGIRSNHDHRRVLEHVTGEYEDDTAVLALVARSAQSIESAHDRAELLKSGALVENSIKAAEADLRREYLQAASGISSSHDKANVLADLLDRSPADASVVQEIVRVARTIESEHDRGRVLKNVIASEAPANGVAEELLTTVEKIGSDNEKASLLIRLAAGPYTPAFQRAVRSVGNDHEKERVIRAIVERGTGLEAAQTAVGLSTSLGGDHSKSQLLLAILDKHGDKPELQPQIRRAAEKIGSDTEYRRVVSKLLKEPGDSAVAR